MIWFHFEMTLYECCIEREMNRCVFTSAKKKVKKNGGANVASICKHFECVLLKFKRMWSENAYIGNFRNAFKCFSYFDWYWYGPFSREFIHFNNLRCVTTKQNQKEKNRETLKKESGSTNKNYLCLGFSFHSIHWTVCVCVSCTDTQNFPFELFMLV